MKHPTLLTSIIFTLFHLNICYTQIDLHSIQYKENYLVTQSVKLGKFGCNYSIASKLDNDKRISESIITIPGKGNLKLIKSYNTHGDLSEEKYLFGNRVLKVEYTYKYKISNPPHNNLSFNRITEQLTTINSGTPVSIKSYLGGNTENILTDQLRDLKKEKDRAIFKLLGEFPKTEKHLLPACNCLSDFQMNLVDELYEYHLFNINDKDAISIKSGRRKTWLLYNTDHSNNERKLEQLILRYNESSYLIEEYTYN